MANSASAKGNPASKRMSNPRNAAERAKCWMNGKKRKDVRKAEAKVAETTNKKLKAAGVPTAWEFAKQLRDVRKEMKRGLHVAKFDEGFIRRYEAQRKEVLNTVR